jgi:protein phosphatase
MTKHEPTPELLFAAKTDVGNVRDHNEDNLLAVPPLFAVADGMGGHAAGEVASEIAIQTIDELAPRSLDREALIKACVQANDNIYQAIEEGRGKEGMGTTLTCAIVEDTKLMIAQIGDSRAYALHGGNLQQLTHDHSYVQELVEQGRISPAEAAHHPKRSIITRALGGDPKTEPDIYELDITGVERLLLCSDGLSSMISDTEIQQIMTLPESPEDTAMRLVTAAKMAGGLDNVTVVVVDLPDPRHPSPKIEQPRRKRPAVAITLYVVIALLIIAAVVVAFFALRSAGLLNTY